MAIRIGEKPLPTFGEPLELLSDCHRRIEDFLGSLQLIAEQARGGTLEPDQREALQEALRYFREAAPRHTQDEEQSLFPRLRRCGRPEVRAVLARLEALEADHQVASGEHEVVERLGRRWLAGGGLSPAESAELNSALHELATIYRRHIAVEDDEIFSLAPVVLARADLDAIGREMASRRGLAPSAVFRPVG